MPEYLRALVYLLLIGGTVWVVAGQRSLGLPIAAADFSRRRNVWLLATLLGFLSHNFWIFMAVLGIVLIIAARREPNLVALYGVVLVAIPPFLAEIPGALGIDHLIALDVPRLLGLVLLLPAWFVLRARPDTDRFGSLLPDRFLAAYLVLYFAAQVPHDSLTNSVRLGLVYPFLEIFLPYYVASRTVRSVQAFRDVAATFAVMGMVLAPIAVFEVLRSWLLYSMLDDALQVPWRFGAYLSRGEGGLLRAQASLGHSLLLGYTMTIALLMFTLLRPKRAGTGAAHTARGRSAPSGRRTPTEGIPRWAWMAGATVLVAGLIAALSRGPWLGAVVGLLVLAVTAPRAMSRLLRVGIGVAVAVVALLMTPIGQDILQFLPFVGTVDSYNVSYRQRLIDVSIAVVMQRPFFGAYDFMSNPLLEQMRQGEGIIDIVNSYLAVALRNGLVGLGLYLGIFATTLWGLVQALRAMPDNTADEHLVGRVLLATLVAVMLIIATVSFILIVPMLCFLLLGLAVGYRQMVLARWPLPRALPAGRYAARR